MGFTWIDRTDWPEPLTEADLVNIFGRGRNYDPADAYDPSDPKHPGYADAVVDFADAQRKRDKGE